MAGHVQPLPALQQAVPQLSFCSKLNELVEIIAQTAIRILFISVSILMAAVTFPIELHAFLIPVTAFGTSVLAGFFFLPKNETTAPYFDPLPPLIRPIQVQPVPVPGQLQANAPRPLVNISNNCAFNSMIHFLESNPDIANWFRHPLTDETDMPTFQNFLAGYHPPAQLLIDFNTYAAAQVPPGPILTMFREFIENYDPPLLDFDEVRTLKEKFEHVIILQRAFYSFLTAYDQAVQENGRVVNANSQSIRLALSRISGIENSEGIQVDASEIMNYVLDALPNNFKLLVSESYHFDAQGLPAVQGYPDGIVPPAPEQPGYIQLSIKENDAVPQLARMIRDYCEDHTTVLKKSVDGINREYPTTVYREFLEAPPALRFQIKRFYNEKRAVSWLTKLKLFFWPDLGWRMVKKDVDVEVPQEMTIRLVTGELRQYRLVSFVTHHGETIQSGHYTAARNVDGQKYFMSDENVTLEDQQAWNARLQRAYLLCYLPV